MKTPGGEVTVGESSPISGEESETTLLSGYDCLPKESANYMGAMSTTTSGKECQDWTAEVRRSLTVD